MNRLFETIRWLLRSRRTRQLDERAMAIADWYEQEAAREMWGTRTLQRNVSSQYYHRLLQSQNKEAVHGEMKQLTTSLQDKLEYIKNPVVAEFLGFKQTFICFLKKPLYLCRLIFFKE